MLRIYLSGRLSVEGETGVLGPAEFPGQQGRVAFAYLVAERAAPVSRAALAEVLWGEDPPAAWQTALSAIVSKLRPLLARVGLDPAGTLRAAGGCYELELPPGTWVDQEAAIDAIHEAEAAVAAGDFRGAYGPSAIALHIARRPFLPGESGHWIEARRERLEHVRVRALECRAEVYLQNGEYPLALDLGQEVVSVRPFRETGYRLQMRAHIGAGNTAEALRVYEECRSLIAEELGVAPSEETKALKAQVLRGS